MAFDDDIGDGTSASEPWTLQNPAGDKVLLVPKCASTGFEVRRVNLHLNSHSRLLNGTAVCMPMDCSVDSSSQYPTLLDDALEFVNKCKAADVAATAKEFDGVLHGWHTFFPLMPVADAAVKEVADFLGPRLRGEPVDDVAVAPARVVAPPPPAAPAAAWTAAPPVAAPEDITQAGAVLTELDVRPTAADLAAAGGARPARPASAGGARPARPSSACRRAGA